MARSKELYMKKQSGFTLVELLVAMAITLVVVAATLGAFNDALRANMLQGANLPQMAPQLGIMAFWLIICFVLALKLFRWR